MCVCVCVYICPTRSSIYHHSRNWRLLILTHTFVIQTSCYGFKRENLTMKCEKRVPLKSFFDLCIFFFSFYFIKLSM